MSDTQSLEERINRAAFKAAEKYFMTTGPLTWTKVPCSTPPAYRADMGRGQCLLLEQQDDGTIMLSHQQYTTISRDKLLI